MAKEGKIFKIALQDGDYVIDNKKAIYKGTKFLNEYHKDGKFMGYVRIVAIKNKKSCTTLAMYEYRLNESAKLNSYGKVIGRIQENESYFKLKHILFLDIDNQQNNPTITSKFIYLADGTLVCCQIDDTIYLSEVNKNLIPDMEKFKFTDKGYSDSEYSPFETVCLMMGVSLMLVAGIGSVAIAPAALAAGAVTAPIWLPILFIIGKNTEENNDND